jgi:hypothetical protein
LAGLAGGTAKRHISTGVCPLTRRDTSLNAKFKRKKQENTTAKLAKLYESAKLSSNG